jgi:hypothetical protein
MAAFGRSLCLILTLWMAGSRSPTVIPPRSPDSSPWWDQDSFKIQKNALRLRKAGDFRAADALYQEGYREAVRRRDRLASVRYLMSAGGCELLAFQYRAALASFLDFGILFWSSSAVCFGPPAKRTGTLIRAKPEAEETRWTGEPRWSCSNRSVESMSSA